MLPQPRRTSPQIAAGSPQDSGLPAASASSARPHSSGPQRPDLGQPRSQRIRCLLGGSGTSRRSRLGTAELPGVPAPSPSGRTGGPCFRTCPDTGSALRMRHIATSSGRRAACAAARRGFPGPLAPATPAVRQPATDPPRRSPRRPSPQNPPSCEPPCHCSHPGGRARKTGLFRGPFFWGGAVTASSLRRSPFGLRRSARDPWRLPGTRRVRSRAGRASRSLPRVSPDAALARAHPHAAAFGGSAASAATRSNDDKNHN